MTYVGTSTPDDHEETKGIRPATLIQLHKLGFKLVPLSSNHSPVVEWTPIYEKLEYWPNEKLIAEYSKFKNVATAYGKTHVKDSEGRDLYLNGFDCDSEFVYKVFTTPIDENSNPLLKSKLEEWRCKFVPDMTTEKVSLLDFLKAVTIVVKTRKTYGFQVFWFTYAQHDHIGTEDCKLEHEFEIKTDKSLGLSTLPPSTHRDDKTKTFRYSHIGRTDKIETIDELCDIFVGLLKKECLKSHSSNVTDNNNDAGNRSRQPASISLYDLSEQMIQTTVAYLTPYYIVGRRHDFALCFSGATWHARVSEDSADKILSQIATNTNDYEIQSRLITLRTTYEKAANRERITGGPTLADLISGVSCELDDARKLVARIQSFWHDDIQLELRRKRKHTVNDSNGQHHNDDVNNISDSSEDNRNDDDYYTTLETELSSTIPDRDYAEFVIKIVKQTVKQEDSLVRQIFYTGISKDTDNPINLAILAPTSEGKTYPLLETLGYLPEKDIWKIGSMSPKVIIRQNGILVDGNNQPIENKLKELKGKIKEAEDESEEKEALEKELKQLRDEAKILIDFRGKLWVFLEPPQRQTWDILKPILSHDASEIEHPYVYDVPGMGFEVKKVVTRGWPACIFCSAKNESKWEVWPEIQSRFLITSPNMVEQKYLDGNMLIAQRMGLPSLLQQSLIVSNDQIELAKKCVYYILYQIKQHNKTNSNKNNGSNVNPVWIPYAQILAQILPARKGVDNRITKRIFSFLRMIALARSHLRSRLDYGNESQVIADLTDLHEVLHITQNLSGIPPFKLKFLKEIFLPLFIAKQSPDKSDDNSKQEKIIAVTTRQLCDAYNQITKKSITTSNLKGNYLDDYLANELIEEEDSELDKRQKIYYPIVDLSTIENGESPKKIKKLSITDRINNILQHQQLMMPKNCNNIPDNWLELEIFDLIKYPFKLGNFELYDENGKRICICRFVKGYEKEDRLNGYFSKPISCNYRTKIFVMKSYYPTIGKEQCKKLSIGTQMDNFFISDKQKTNGSVNAAEGTTSPSVQPRQRPTPLTSGTTAEISDLGLGSHTSNTSTESFATIDYDKNMDKISLRHSPTARVSTNDDFEYVEDSSGNSSGGSISTRDSGSDIGTGSGSTGDGD